MEKDLWASVGNKRLSHADELLKGETVPTAETVETDEKLVEITIDFSKIPEEVQERLVIGTLAAVRRFLVQPGGKEMLDAKVAEMQMA